MSRRPVSPSIIAQQQREREQAQAQAAAGAAATEKYPPLKRALEEAMGTLDDMASSGDVTSKGYLDLAKSLKSVHTSSEKKTNKVAKNVVIGMASQAPFTMIWCPSSVNTFDDGFVVKLLKAREKRVAKCQCNRCHERGDDAWLRELVQYYLGESGTCPLSVYNAIVMLLSADPDGLGPTILYHMNTVLSDMPAVEVFCDDTEEAMIEVISLYPNRDFFDWVTKDLTPDIDIKDLEMHLQAQREMQGVDDEKEKEAKKEAAQEAVGEE